MEINIHTAQMGITGYAALALLAPFVMVIIKEFLKAFFGIGK